ncbi:MAG: hypothetical protein YHS30scaffold324_50 [Catenulispora phage 69_17]|jgi:hypothetical protein|nr:MAG: hypothetical protein YHS30scaffold324_50 [Catenulispora phage 69_17]
MAEEQPPGPRQRALDVRSGLEGEIMPSPYPDHLRGPDTPHRSVNLRPVGGGVEWSVPREFLQLIHDPGQQP